MKSDIVEEMYQTQDVNGGWGRFQSKDYSVKAKIPTSSVGIVRCLYIGLTVEDRDILFMAEEYLKGLLLGTSREKNWEKNERATPWRRAGVSICWKRSGQILRFVTRHGVNGCS